MSQKRVSVAAIAPIWISPNKDPIKVAVLNSPDSVFHVSGAPTPRNSASAFGGSVSLTPDELEELISLSATPERLGSFDARLLVPEDRLDLVISWFVTRGAERWLREISREVYEEALLEGTPILTPDAFAEISFTFEKSMRLVLGSGDVRSAAASKTTTEYLWWIYRVDCSVKAWQQLKASPRVIMPTAEEITNRQSNGIVLSATLAL